MEQRRLHQLRVRATLLITLLIWSLLVWQHFHDGVPSHSFLAREDMPAISNWWGAVLIPLLSWFLLGRIEQRLMRAPDHPRGASRRALLTGAGFVGALLFGVSLAALFSLGRSGPRRTWSPRCFRWRCCFRSIGPSTCWGSCSA